MKPPAPRPSRRRRLLTGLVIMGLTSAAVLVVKRSVLSVSLQVPLYRQKGAEAATVVITEYSDFQCPACAKVQPVLKDLAKKYEKDVLVVFRHRPWNNHKWARLAAKAAEAAGAQGRFWEYHDALFEKQAEWSGPNDPTSLFVGYAEHLRLDKQRFQSDLQGARFDDLIHRDMEAAEALSVNVTPTFFINKRRIAGGSQLSAYGAHYIELEKKP
jgi:protein-disulfide isomerase